MYHADTRQNHASLHDTQTELEEWESSTVHCFWNRPLGRMLNRERGVSGSGAAQIFQGYLSELADLGRHAHLVKQSETCPVMKDGDDLRAR
jgi:hypothetical protein